MRNWERILIGPETSIRDALLKIDAAGTQIALVVDEQRRLLGTLSDGDIRRGLINGLQLSDPIKPCMHPTPTTVRVGESRDSILSLMRRLGVHQMPIVDGDNVVMGLGIVDDFLTSPERENWVVVMAGGPGTRLKELTKSTPKPMLKVGDRPLLETILRNYIDHGFRRFYLAVHYRAEVIEAHFGDGSALGTEIRYLREAKRMGTAGALSLLPEMPTDPFLVANGDVLVKVDYGDMLDTHIRTGAAATLAVREYQFQIPYGVVEEDDGSIQRIEEKPIRRSLVAAGMYVLSPEAVRLVPRDKFFDMPSLIDNVIAKGGATRCYLIHGYWLDIGRMSDYRKANDDYQEMFE
jgi:dTDP-glucose pyrophosphorylase